MSKVLYTDFEGVKDIIDTIMDNPHLKKAITKTNLYKFWNNILPTKLKGKSKPYGMLPGGIMTVACENPVVAQELNLHKIMLLNKFKPFANSLNIRVLDLKFSPKQWESIK